MSIVLRALGYEGRGGDAEEVVDCARAVLQRAAGSRGAGYRCGWAGEFGVFEYQWRLGLNIALLSCTRRAEEGGYEEGGGS